MNRSHYYYMYMGVSGEKYLCSCVKFADSDHPGHVQRPHPGPCSPFDTFNPMILLADREAPDLTELQADLGLRPKARSN